MAGKRCRVHIFPLLAPYLLAALVVLITWAYTTAAPMANWRFGQVQITPFGTRRVLLYMSLRNVGRPSTEAVHLHLLPPTASRVAGTPIFSLTRFTRGQRSTVVKICLQLPPWLKSPDDYRLFLQVEQSITDMLPVVGGRPLSNAPARQRFQQ